MPSRRTLLGRLGTVGLLGTSLAGVTAGSAVGSAATPDPTDATDPTTTIDAERAAAPNRNTPYDAGRLAAGDTVVTAIVDPAAVSTVGLPEPWSTRLSAAMARANVSLADADSVAGSVALSGETVEGATVVRGSFDPDRLAAAVEDRGLWSTARTRRAGRTVRRFRGREEPYAVAVDESELAVGYAPTVDRAAAHVDAAAGRSLGEGTTNDSTPTGSETVPPLLAGDAVVYADLGETGRDRLRSVVSDSPAALEATVEAAGSLGVALGVTGGVDDGIDLRYTATLDPTRLTRGRLRRLSDGIDGEGVLADATVEFRGRTAVVDATPTREELFAVHDDTIGAEFGE